MKGWKRFVAVWMMLSLFLTACGAGGQDPTEPSTAATTDPVELSGTVNVEIQGFDWGPAVTKIMLTLDHSVAGESVSEDTFLVTETKEAYNAANPDSHGTVTEQRRVIGAYTSDDKGNQVDASNRIVLVLGCSPSEGSPYCYDRLTRLNALCDPYGLEIALTENAMLKTDTGAPVSDVAVNSVVDLKNAVYPQLEGVDLSGVFTGTDGKTLTYGSYVPEEDGGQHPLVIWLHGSGEGGTDAALPVLGNKVTALYGQEFQNIMGGAYVLTPQTQDYWMVYDEERDFQDNPGISSVYHGTLMELIEAYVNAHPAIDRGRIYVGGCSNGGYMTMDLVMNHPEFLRRPFQSVRLIPMQALPMTS